MNSWKLRLKTLFKPKSEDWVVRALKQKQKKPLLISMILIIGIFAYNFYESYIIVKDLEDKVLKTQKKVVDYKKKINNIDSLILRQNGKIDELKNLSVSSKKPIAVLNKVCELLKSRDVIGSFYIIKRKNKKYANVLDIEIQISYGDKDLLLTIVQIVMDKVFYLKSIEKTKLGVKCEIYKPAQK